MTRTELTPGRHILAAPTQVLRDALAKRLGSDCLRVGQEDEHHSDLMYEETVKLLEEQNPAMVALIEEYAALLETRPGVCLPTVGGRQVSVYLKLLSNIIPTNICCLCYCLLFRLSFFFHIPENIHVVT